MILTLTTTVLAAISLQTADPLAPARGGDQLCYVPDAAAKTCMSIAAYSFGADGVIVSDARTAISASPVITMTTRTPIMIRDGFDCSNASDLTEQIVAIHVTGAALEGASFETTRTQIATEVANVIGGDEVCTVYQTQADGTLLAVSRVDGNDRADLSTPVLWIKPGEGWTVSSS